MEIHLLLFILVLDRELLVKIQQKATKSKVIYKVKHIRRKRTLMTISIHRKLKQRQSLQFRAPWQTKATKHQIKKSPDSRSVSRFLQNQPTKDLLGSFLKS